MLVCLLFLQLWMNSFYISTLDHRLIIYLTFHQLLSPSCFYLKPARFLPLMVIMLSPHVGDLDSYPRLELLESCGNIGPKLLSVVG